jgi:predicted SAM-dependent methyltransferase
MTTVKLNLGCYDKKLPGFTNLDIRPECDPDVVDDAFKLETFENSSIQEIYSSHMLEHLSRDDSKKALCLWYDKLQKGGVLRLAVPDMEAVLKRYIYTGNLRELENLIFGSQRHSFDFHYMGWDFKTLKEDLEEVGFASVSKWNWWEIDPYRYVDDFSHSYLPSDSPDIALSHGRVIKGEGKLMSLNVEAYKE